MVEIPKFPQTVPALPNSAKFSQMSLCAAVPSHICCVCFCFSFFPPSFSDVNSGPSFPSFHPKFLSNSLSIFCYILSHHALFFCFYTPNPWNCSQISPCLPHPPPQLPPRLGVTVSPYCATAAKIAGIYSDAEPPRKTMRRGVLMTLLQQSAMTLPLWIGKPGDK